VVKHVLQRKGKEELNWTDLQTWTNTLSGEQNFLDSTHTDLLEWNYRVLAYDEAKLVSSSVIGNVKITNPKRPKVNGLKSEIAYANNLLAVKLSWEYPNDQRVHDFVVYRATGTEDFVLYKTLDRAKHPPVTTLPNANLLYAWKDLEVKPGTTYRYWMVARYLDGVETPASLVVQLGL
jgi:hypothetical protein